MIIDVLKKLFGKDRSYKKVCSCIDCKGKGWDLYQRSDTGTFEIQRCDVCEHYPNDIIAGEVAFETIYDRLLEEGK